MNRVLDIGLTSFAPLIQIWTGVCLLFFYESILQTSPLHKHIKRFYELYNAFFNKYQGYLGLKDKPKHYVSNWNNFLPAIKNMAALSFFYSLFLLFYVGLESSNSYWYHALPVMNCAIILYVVICMMFSGYKLFHSYVTPLLYTIALILYFYFYISTNGCLALFKIWNGPSLLNKGVTFGTLFACVSGLPLIVLRIIYDYFYIRVKSAVIRELDANFDMMWEVKIGRKELKDLSQELQEKIIAKAADEYKEKGEVSKEAIKKFIDEEITEEYESFINPWYKRSLRNIFPSLNI